MSIWVFTIKFTIDIHYSWNFEKLQNRSLLGIFVVFYMYSMLDGSYKKIPKPKPTYYCAEKSAHFTCVVIESPTYICLYISYKISSNFSHFYFLAGRPTTHTRRRVWDLLFGREKKVWRFHEIFQKKIKKRCFRYCELHQVLWRTLRNSFNCPQTEIW
jgi:hypothetical protein